MTFREFHGKTPDAELGGFWKQREAEWCAGQAVMREKIAVAAEKLPDIAPVSAPILARLARAMPIE